MTITCTYCCVLCKAKDVKVEVPVRTTDQTIQYWMEKVCVPALVRAHRWRNWLCKPKVLTHIKIPVTGAAYVGGPVVN